MARPKPEDRRVQKTQTLLREALASLIREKPYESISVREILDRANVGRSTFYMHFPDKDALLVGGIHDMVRAVGPQAKYSTARGCESVIQFSLPIFEFHHRHKHGVEPRIGPRGQAILHGHLQRVLAQQVAGCTKSSLRGQRGRVVRISPDLLAQYVASTFVLVLNWWLESASRLAPGEINEVFRTLVLPTLAAVRG